MTTYEPRCPALHPGLPYSRCAREKGHGMLHCNASGNTWDYSSDLMDGGVTAALIDQEAEPDLRVDYEAMWWKAESRAEEALAAVSETEGRVTAARERTEEIREELRNADQLILVERARAERAEKERDQAVETALTVQQALDKMEHRATRAEAQSALRGRAAIIYRERAREAEAERGWDRMLASKYPEVSDLASGWQERAERAEALIRAVEDVLEESEARGPVGMTFNGTPFPAWISIATIRRALDGDA